MAILYVNIAKAVALRSNQLGDAVTAAEFEDLFTGALVDGYEGMDLPLSALKQQILASEKYIASFVAKLDNPVLYGEMLDRTNDTDDGEELDLTNFVGTLLTIKDSDTDEELTEKPKQEVRRLKRLIAAGKLPATTYHYCRAGATLYHTVESAYAEGLYWSPSSQSARYGQANGRSPLPQELEVMLTAHVLANIASEEWFVNEAQTYAAMFDACQRQLAQGVIPSAKLPDTTANVEPVKN